MTERRQTILQARDPMTGRPLGAPRVLSQFPLAEAGERLLSYVETQRVQNSYPERGTIEQVLAWVGYDPDRAKAAIAAEHDRGKPRKTLLAELSVRSG